MSKIFDGDSDTEIDVKINNDYARNYDTWRKKEEINRIKTKYGENSLNYEEDSSSSSSDDEEGVELTQNVEEDFFKTLSCLKNKDPRIYDENVRFFRENSAGKTKKMKEEKPMFLKDYERALILEKNGELSDEEVEENQRAHSPSYVEEQRKIKESFKKVLNEGNEEEGENWGGLFTARQKTVEEVVKEEQDYKEWLEGQKKELEDKTMEAELQPLRDYWTNPKLEEGEKFLRDYILKKKFLDQDDGSYVPTYDEVVHDSDEDLSNDEEAIEKQEEFEHKYNFRFEEPDQDFIKRYPRTMENSLRRPDNKRKVKRAETKERKLREKEDKKKELKQLQELKKKEIEEKIAKLKEITGNDEVAFKNVDLDEDFDPEKHDQQMQAIFNEEYYQGEEGEQKPEFPEIDEELEIENYERWDEKQGDYEDLQPHCEDDNFNMDCDYDPSAQKELTENSKGKKKKRRKSKFAELASKPKPSFDPKDKTYDEYLDEYYKLDCEDIIGDLPVRFKYRQVVPNDFGLSVEEILMANDRELNRWCSIKKITQHRPENVEKYEQMAFKKKSQNLTLKQKILTSLFTSEKAEAEQPSKQGETLQEVKTEDNKPNKNLNNEEEKTKSSQEKKTKKKKKKNKKVVQENGDKVDSSKRKRQNSEQNSKKPNKKLKTNKNEPKTDLTNARLTAYGINPKKFKNKLKYS